LSTLFVEFDPPEPCPYAFDGDTSDVVYFLSFAFSTRYPPDRPACPAGRQLDELARMAEWTAEREAKVRLTYNL
jgi:hypothetical protein